MNYRSLKRRLGKITPFAQQWHTQGFMPRKPWHFGCPYVTSTPQSIIDTYEAVMAEHQNVAALRMFDADIVEHLTTLRAIGGSDPQLYHQIALGLSGILFRTARTNREGRFLIPNKKVAIVIVGRATEVMAKAAEMTFPGITVYCVDVERDRKTGLVQLPYNNIDSSIAKYKLVYVLGFTLATGRTIQDTIELFADIPNKTTFPNGGNWVPMRKISFVGIIGCPKGIRHLQQHHPIPITLAGIDMGLSNDSHILAHPEEVLSENNQRIYRHFRRIDLVEAWETAEDEDARQRLLMIGDYGER